MLRVIAHKSAAAAHKYYADGLKREDYYAEGQEIVGKWYGRGAEILGLSGDVTPDGFAALVENRNPETGERLTPRTKADRRVGYDLNFHAPKSLSLLHALTGDKELLTAFRSAVAETMTEIETQAATRVRRAGAEAERITGNLVWAEFIHLTARPVGGIPDPHLHIHCFAFNATHDEAENRWKAASWAGIKKDASYYEAAFHSRLTEKIAGLGYGISRTRQGWEITGIPRPIIDRFSRRSAQIDRLAAKKGIIDPKAKDALGAASREGKRHGMAYSDLLAAWGIRLTEDEKAQIFKVAEKAPRLSSPRLTPSEAFDEATEKLFEKDSVVEAKRLVAEALRFGVGHFSPQEAWRELGKRELVGREIDGQMLCAPYDVIAEEVSLINFARSGRNMFAPIGPGKTAFLNSALSGEQRAAVEHILKSRDQVIAIRGAAGVGKTTLMKEAAKQIEANGQKIFAFAPSSDASRDTLRKEGFANAETVAHLLVNKKLQEQLRGSVIWVDESGLIGTRDMWRVMQLAKNDTQIILTGDSAQHASISRGTPFHSLQEYAGLKIAYVTQIRRQEGKDYRKAVHALSKGDLKTGFEKLDGLGAFVEIPDDAERYRLLARDYLALSRKGSVPLVISPTHREGAAVTETIRAAKREVGQLGPERLFTRYHDLRWEVPDRRRPENYSPGLVVQFHQNARGIRRGAVFRVTNCDDEGRVWVKDAENREIVLPLKDAKRFQVFEPREISLARGDRIRITHGGKTADGHRLNNGNVFTVEKFTRSGQIVLSSGAILGAEFCHFTYGYCQTSHSSQSKSVRDVLIAQSADSFLASSKEQIYVSASRARNSIRIYTDDINGLQEAVGNSSIRRSGIELAGFTSEDFARMNGELGGQKWREHLNKRVEGVDKNHVRDLLRHRQQDGLAKTAEKPFQQYVEMRRKLAGPDGKSRSKGHPTVERTKAAEVQNRRRSFLRPTELTAGTKAKLAEPKPEPKAQPKRSLRGRLERAYVSSAKHFKKVTERVKGAAKAALPEKIKTRVPRSTIGRESNLAIQKSNTKTPKPTKTPTKAITPVIKR